MSDMNRREFTKTLAAAAAIPSLPIQAKMAATSKVSMQSIRWAAVYLSNLQGKFTPQMVSQITGLESTASKRIVDDLVANNLITPAHAIGNITTGRSFTSSKAQAETQLHELAKAPEQKHKLDEMIERTDEALENNGGIEDAETSETLEEPTDEQA